jgi:hypothetical protein
MTEGEINVVGAEVREARIKGCSSEIEYFEGLSHFYRSRRYGKFFVSNV